MQSTASKVNMKQVENAPNSKHYTTKHNTTFPNYIHMKICTIALAKPQGLVLYTLRTSIQPLPLTA